MDIPVPDRIGRYQLSRKVGDGATSHVYLAHDSVDGRDVALKVFLPNADVDPKTFKLLKKSFINEALLAGKLDHPHIVQIFDAAVENSYSYLVMEYVPGTTLDSHASPATLLPLGKVVEIVFKCIRALDFAFQNGVIHRDIKPGNILMGVDGDIKISDFGASLQRHAKEYQSTQIMGIGSPAYMSPEQVRLEEITHQTDIYSLGVVMYKLVTGRLPYQATSQVNLIYQILNRPPPPPRTLRPELPPLLDTIIMHAMAKSRENRYQSWIEFGRDLTKAFSTLRLSGETISDSQKFHELRGLDFFRYFTDAELWETLRISVWRMLPAGDVIIREGEQGESFFILVSGEVDVTLRGKPLSAINRGGCFGEIPYMSEHVRQRATTIRARSPVAALEIKGSAITRATEACQVQFNKALIQVLIERLDYANALLAER